MEDLSDLWNGEFCCSDNILLKECEKIEENLDTHARYFPIIEDIMIDDELLLKAVNEIEKE